MLRYLASAALPPGQPINEELIASIAPMLDQVGSVLGEVLAPNSQLHLLLSCRYCCTAAISALATSVIAFFQLAAALSFPLKIANGCGFPVQQVGDGHVEFQPSPAENRQLVRTQYTVPATLLVAFRDDAIDESAEMAALLQQVQPRGALPAAACCFVPKPLRISGTMYASVRRSWLSAWLGWGMLRTHIDNKAL